MSLLREGHKYSYSQLSSFSECPYAFYLQRIEGLNEQASNGFAERGSLIHDLLDQWAKGKLKKEDMITEYINRYPSEVVTAWPRMLASKGYAQKAYDSGIEFLENFDEFSGFEIVSSEEEFNIDLPMTNGETRPFIGFIDLILRSETSGNLIVCDHKSKSMTAFKKAEDEMYKQQLLYSIHVKKKYGKYPDALMFHLFNEEGKKVQRAFTEQDLNDTLSWATEQIQKIEGFTMLDWLECKEKPDFYCTQLCSARRECPQGIGG